MTLSATPAQVIIGHDLGHELLCSDAGYKLQQVP